MSRTLKIEGLSDAQCDALAEEAKAAGRKFYDHCRDKLLAGIVVWVSGEVSPSLRRFVPEATSHARLAPPAVDSQASEPPVSDDRIGRLEAMMARMGETLEMLATNPVVVVGAQPVADNTEIDVDDIVGQSLAAAEQAGLTVIEREEPAQNGGVRHIGQRRPAPFSVSAVPQHLRNL